MERADRGVGEILAALDRAGVRSQHAGDLHQRQRRRVAVAQCAALQSQVLRSTKAAFACPRSSAGPAACRPASSRRRSASRWISSATFLAAAGVTPAGRREARRHRSDAAASRRREADLTHVVLARRRRRLESTRGSRRRLEAAARGQALASCCSTSARTSASAMTSPRRTPRSCDGCYQQLLAWEKDVDAEAKARCPKVPAASTSSRSTG